VSGERTLATATDWTICCLLPRHRRRGASQPEAAASPRSHCNHRQPRLREVDALDAPKPVAGDEVGAAAQTGQARGAQEPIRKERACVVAGVVPHQQAEGAYRRIFKIVTVL
jgi:hypothetical protein